MNFTGGTTLPSIGKRINWQLVSLAAGLAVAISAAGLYGAFERGGSPTATSAMRPDSPAIPAPAVPAITGSTEVAIILVASQAEAETMRSVLSTEVANWPELTDDVARTTIVALETPGDEAEFLERVALATLELMAVDTNVRIVDLRMPPGGGTSSPTGNTASHELPAVYVVGSEAEQRQHEQRLGESGTTNFSIVVIEPGSLQGDTIYNTLAGEQREAGTFEVIDLRY